MFELGIIIVLIILVLGIIYNAKVTKKTLDDFYDYLDSNVNFEDFKYSREKEEFTTLK